MHILSKNLKSNYGPIIFLITFYALFHIALTPGYWDDEYFKNSMDGSISNLFSFLYNRYSIWSPRIIIELTISILSILPYTVWKILDILIILLLYKDIECFLKHFLDIDNIGAKYELSCLLCSIPFSIMACTGWVATTMNYLWVISLGWYSVNKILHNIILEKELSKIEKILTTLAIIYSCNFESVALLMLVGMILATLYEKYFRHKKNSVFLWVQLMVITLLFVSFALCPGNKHRLASDIKLWMPDFEQLNFADKLRMGIVTAFMHFVSIPSPIFFMLSSSCLAAASIKKGTYFQKIVAACPVTLDILWTCYFIINYLLGKKTMTYQVPNPLLAGGTDMIEQITMLITIVLWFASLLYSLYRLLNAKKDFYLCFTVLLISCVPEIIVGMSATVANSMLRTVIYLYLSMIILILCLWKEIKVFWPQFKWLRLAVCLTLACSIALNAAQMARHILIYG